MRAAFNKRNNSYTITWTTKNDHNASDRIETEGLNMKDRLLEIRQWASQRVTEYSGNSPGAYLETVDSQILLNRLEDIPRGQAIAVIGLQGSGKTALKEYLSATLSRSLSFKWTTQKKVKDFVLSTIQYETPYDSAFEENTEADKIMSKLNNILNLPIYNEYNISIVCSNIMNFIKSSDPKEHTVVYEYILYLFGNYEDDPLKELQIKGNMLENIIPKIKKSLGNDVVNEIKNEIFIDSVNNAGTILIEFPDYDKRSRGQSIRDLRNFQEFLEDLFNNQKSTGIQTPDLPNLVIFFQQELWEDDHFMKGKFESIYIKPFTEEELSDYYIKTFGGAEPFTLEALLYIGKLSRGIFRWFKKYISICIERMDLNKIDVITAEIVMDWITSDIMYEDWKRELGNVFKGVGRIRKALEILKYLIEKGVVEQDAIMKDFFGDDGSARTACSRALNKLEEKGYISKEQKGRRNLVKFIRPV